MVKMPPISIETVSGHFRPRSSDQGAQISGPDAKPSTYRVVPSVPTSDPTPNSLLALLIAGAKMALVNETMKVPPQTRLEVKSLVRKMSPSVSRPIIRSDILGGALPVVGMNGIIRAVKLDCVILGSGKGWRDGFAHAHG